MSEPQTVTAEQVNDLRRRVLNDEPWDREELATIVKQLTADRLRATTKPVKGRKKKAPVKLPEGATLDDLLADSTEEAPQKEPVTETRDEHDKVLDFFS